MPRDVGIMEKIGGRTTLTLRGTALNPGPNHDCRSSTTRKRFLLPAPEPLKARRPPQVNYPWHWTTEVGPTNAQMSKGKVNQCSFLIWGIVKIMVPFWVPQIRPRIRPRIMIGTQKGTIILTIPHLFYTSRQRLKTWHVNNCAQKHLVGGPN